MLFSGLHDQFLEPDINRSDQHLAPIFRAPDEMVLQAENRPGVVLYRGSAAMPHNIHRAYLSNHVARCATRYPSAA